MLLKNRFRVPLRFKKLFGKEEIRVKKKLSKKEKRRIRRMMEALQPERLEKKLKRERNTRMIMSHNSSGRY